MATIKYWNCDRIALGLSLPSMVGIASVIFAFLLHEGQGKAFDIFFACAAFACAVMGFFTGFVGIYYLASNSRKIRGPIQVWCWFANGAWLIFTVSFILPRFWPW
jgi:hypothetical protein